MEIWFITWGAIVSRYSSAVIHKQICFVQRIFIVCYSIVISKAVK